MPMTRRGTLLAAGALAASGVLPLGEDTTSSVAQAETTSNGELVCLSDFEPAAKERMTQLAWEYFSGGSADEITMRANREAYQRIRLKPRVLRDVSKLDTRVTLFGNEHPFPILLAPTAYHKLANVEGELATARGASAANATMILSSFSTTSVEDVASSAARPIWFQLYAQTDQGFTRSLVQRAEASGAQALCLTVDTPVLGPRNREDRVRFKLPEGFGLPNMSGLKTMKGGMSHRPSAEEIYSSLLDPLLTWNDVESLRSFAKVPLLLKGILNPDDAERAVQAGAAGIIVSNHGGRNLDTVPATADALPQITDRVAGRIPVLVDGGVRRGTDVLKALAMGANAVLIGRPYLYGLGVEGAAGVTRVVKILQREFEMAMALAGRTSLAEIDRSVLWT
jgi:4-hydroxymandelate oxidase